VPSEARVEGRFASPETGDETVLCARRPARRPAPRLRHGRLATVGELAEGGPRARRPPRATRGTIPLLAPAVRAAHSTGYAGAPRADAARPYRAARARWLEARRRLPALGGDARARAREIDLPPLYQSGDLGPPHSGPGRRRPALESEEALLADGVAHRDALTRAYEALEGTRPRPVGTALAALDAVPLSRSLAARLRDAGARWPTSHRSCGGGGASHEDPERVETCGTVPSSNQLHELGPQVRIHPRRRDRLRRGGGRPPRRARARTRSVPPTSRPAAPRTNATPPLPAADRSTALRAPPNPSAPRGGRHLRELAMPHAVVEIEWSRVRPPTDGHPRPVDLPLAANPGERARPLPRPAFRRLVSS